jgi:hypothetical protein
MSLIGSVTGSGSSVFNLDFLPEKFLINVTAGAQDLTNLSVVCSGSQLMSITDSARIDALQKFDNGGVLGFSPETAAYLRLATGRINKATTITATNGAVSAVPVYAASTNMSSVARRAVEQSINPSANATFNNFECLIFSSTNVLRAQITFDNGFTDEYTPQEINALYASYHIAEQNGQLSGLSVIDADSGAGKISQVVLYIGSGGSTTVLKTDYVQL